MDYSKRVNVPLFHSKREIFNNEVMIGKKKKEKKPASSQKK